MTDEKVVLLVEDNDDDIELTLRSFEKHHLANRIVVVRDGEQALDYLFARGSYAQRNRLELPAVVLLDLKLPRMDGFEVLRQVRASPLTRCTPVVVLTTSSQPADKYSSYHNGANSYVRKPVNFDDFISVTRQLGLYWLQINEPPPVDASKKEES
jgi:two-component system response regulator